MPKLDDYLQIAEAAEYLGVCKNTLRNWGELGKLAEHRHPINNYRLYRKKDLDQLLKRIENSAKPKPR
jgi:excisionase family DNA binding protein